MTCAVRCYMCATLQYNDMCWKGAPNNMADLGSVFPTASIHFEGGGVLPLRPVQYLFVLSQGGAQLRLYDCMHLASNLETRPYATTCTLL